MKTTKNTIELEEFRAEKSKVFTGRDRGEYVREESKIDQIEATNADVYTSSFLITSTP